MFLLIYIRRSSKVWQKITGRLLDPLKKADVIIMNEIKTLYK